MKKVLKNRIYNLHCKKDRSCSICLDEQRITMSTCYVTSCGHIFHEDCIKSHFEKVSSKCPICNYKQDIKTVEELDPTEYNPQLVTQIENFDAIKNLIETDIDVIVGYDMFIYAAEMGRLDVIDFILDNLNHNELNFLKVLEIVTKNNNLDIFTFIIEDAILLIPDIINSNDGKLVRIACKNGNVEILSLLIEYGADISLMDDDALRWACTNGHISCVNILLENAADVSACDYKALRVAIEYGKIDVIKILISHIEVFTIINSEFMDTYNIHESFQWAIKNGHIDCIELLIGYNINVNHNNFVALNYAIAYKHIKIVEFLFQHITKAYVAYADFEIPLRLAVLSKQYEVVALLLTYTLTKNNITNHLLSLASTNDNMDTLELLLKHNIEPIKDQLLKLIIMKGHTNDLKILLNNGANLQYEIFRVLESKTQNPHMQNEQNKQNKAVYYAAKYDQVGILKVLLEHGVNLHSLDNNALRIAVENENIGAVKFLVENGADLKIYNYEPLSIAVRTNNYYIVCYILEQYKLQNLAITSDADLYYAITHFKSEYGPKSIIKELLDNGADKFVTYRVILASLKCSCYYRDAYYHGSQYSGSDSDEVIDSDSDSDFEHNSECGELQKIIRSL